MIVRFIAVVGLLLCGGASAGEAAAMSTAPAVAVAPAAVAEGGEAQTPLRPPYETGWRFRQGNICLQDWSGGVLSDGMATAARWWSLAQDINLFPRKNCEAAGFRQAQTITVITYSSYSDWYYGICRRSHVWTNHGYQKPGLVERAVVHINRDCNLMYMQDRIYAVAHGVGVPLGLKDQPAGNGSTVMSSAGGPKPWDFQLIEQIYPW